MFLKSIRLLNFRNYTKVSYSFKTKATVLIGDNSQGKTNFLESIYFLAAVKSPRAEEDCDLVRVGQSVLKVDGLVEDQAEQDKLEVTMQVIDDRLKKQVKVNGVPKRVMDYTGNLVSVMFSPEDINLVTGSPSSRRSHIDLTLCQIDRDYKKACVSYENVVTNKNRLLKRIKEGLSKPDELTFWSSQQLKDGAVISYKRKHFFEFINAAEKKFGNFSFEFVESSLTPSRLAEYQQKEIEATVSLIGPHRDDFIFKLNSQDLAKFGSRGEQRTAVLDLKLSEVAFTENVIGKRPILLLDDIFSELDLQHRQHVLDIINLQQTIIASVELDNFLKKKLKDATFLFVQDGNVIEIADK